MSGILKKLLKLALVVYVFVFFYQWWRPLPLEKEPIAYSVPGESVAFYGDTTALDKKGERVLRQEVWNAIFRMIDGAERYVLVDMYLWNDWQGATPETARALSRELADRLVAVKARSASSTVVVIVDPVNTLYGGAPNPELERMKNAGVTVLMPRVDRFRDADLFYSAFWRSFVQWFKNGEGGYLPHPLDAGSDDVSLRSWLAFMNMRANERALVLADNGKDGKLRVLLTSLGAADRASADLSSAVAVSDRLWLPMIAAEGALPFPKGEGVHGFSEPDKVNDDEGELSVTYLNDEEVGAALLRLLDRAQAGDTLSLTTERLADRKVVAAIKAAADRGAKIRLLLDPNIHWMHYAQHGIPSRVVGNELFLYDIDHIDVRYCAVRAEHCRANFLAGTVGKNTLLMVFSSGWTRRTLRGFNATAAISVKGDEPFTAWNDALRYYDDLWENKTGSYSVGVDAYRDDPWWMGPLYHFMERTGISVF